jgi:DHA1 family quinolone resistance protein-like MFS transporter
MKYRIYSFIMLLNSFLNGLLAPVLSLIILDKGGSISSLSIVLGLYAFTVIVLELPSGIFADVFGRKKSFCSSIIISMISIIILLFSKNIIFICIAMMVYGLSRALSSGSFDALFIDHYINTYGKDKMHNVTTRLAVLDTLGMSAGALSGGFLPQLSKTYITSIGVYDLNLIVRIALSLIVAILSFTFIQEDTIHKNEERVGLKQHIKNSSMVVSKNSTIICIFISVFATGFFLSGLETYWQPHFITLLPNEGMMGLLGIMSFLYFAAATLGSISANKIISKFKLNSKKMYLSLRLLLAVSLILTAMQTNLPVFIILYSSIYLFLGMAGIPEGVVLNNEIPNEVRASVLSVSSLSLQIGGLTGSVLYSILINYISIPSIWIFTASIVIISVLVTAKKLLLTDHKVLKDA